MKTNQLERQFINGVDEWSGLVGLNGVGHQAAPTAARQVHQLSLLFALPLREAKKKKRVEWLRAAVFFVDLLGYGLPPLLQRRNSIPFFLSKEFHFILLALCGINEEKRRDERE